MNISSKSGAADQRPRKVPLVIEGATPALGQASQAIKIGNVVYVSGQLPINPETGKIVENDIAAQTGACIKSLEKITDFLGGGLASIVKVSVYVTDLKDLPGMESIYKVYFDYNPPVRTIVEVSRLPMNARIQVDAVIYPPPREKPAAAF